MIIATPQFSHRYTSSRCYLCAHSVTLSTMAWRVCQWPPVEERDSVSQQPSTASTSADRDGTLGAPPSSPRGISSWLDLMQVTTASGSSLLQHYVLLSPPLPPAHALYLSPLLYVPRPGWGRSICVSQQRLSIHSCLFLALQSVLILCINYYLLQKRAALPKPEMHTICGIQTQSVGRMLVGQAAVGFFLVLMTSGDGLLTSFTAPDRKSLWRRPHIQSEIISLTQWSSMICHINLRNVIRIFLLMRKQAWRQADSSVLLE